MALTGCSIAMTSRPSAIARGDVPTCETTHAPIIVDSVAAILPLAVGGVLTYLGLAKPGENATERGNNLGLSYGLPALVIGVGFVGSAVWGKLNTSACTDQIDEAIAAVTRAAAAGDCEPVIEFATQLVRRDPSAAVLLFQDANVAKCLAVKP